MSNTIHLEKDISEKLYKECKDLLYVSTKTETLLDNKLLLDIFSRRVAIYIHGKHPFEDNEFKLVITHVNNEKIDISVGTIKKSINEEPTIVYGII